jgi:hypothetical protein
MLITFSTKVSADITMFGDVAVELLKLMGQTGAVPGALLGPDIPPALEKLRHGIAAIGARPAGNPPPDPLEEDEAENRAAFVSLRQRAVPLMQLLDAAARENADVIWREASHSML